MPKLKDIKRAESLDDRVASLLKELQAASETIMRKMAAEEAASQVHRHSRKPAPSFNLDLAGSLEDQIETMLRSGMPNPDAPGAPPSGADARPPGTPTLKLHVPPPPARPPLAPPAAANPAGAPPVASPPRVATVPVAEPPVAIPPPVPRPVIAEPADVEPAPAIEPAPPPTVKEPADMAPPVPEASASMAPVGAPEAPAISAPAAIVAAAESLADAPAPAAQEPIEVQASPSIESQAPVEEQPAVEAMPEPRAEVKAEPKPAPTIEPAAPKSEAPTRPTPVDIKSLDDQLAEEAASLIAGEITDEFAAPVEDTPPPPIPMPRSEAPKPAPKPVAPPPPPEPVAAAPAPVTTPQPTPPAATPEPKTKAVAAAGKAARQAASVASPLILRGLDAMNAPLRDQPASVRAVVGYSALITGFWAMVVWAFILFFRQPTPPVKEAPPAETPAKADGHATPPAKAVSHGGGGH